GVVDVVCDWLSTVQDSLTAFKSANYEPKLVDLGQVDVFFGGLEAEECPSKNGIRCGPLLDGAGQGAHHEKMDNIRPVCGLLFRLVRENILMMSDVSRHQNILIVDVKKNYTFHAFVIAQESENAYLKRENSGQV
ncbi:hypothetical protein L195_g046049, partial [Trifolium pratense]